VEGSARVNILKPLILLVTATVVHVLLIVWSLDSFGFRGPTSAFLVNWLVMSWVAVVSQGVRFSLPARYYDLRPFEQTGRLYEHLGIRFFKRLMRRRPFSAFSPALRPPGERTISALQGLDGEMRKAEACHVFIFALMLLFGSYTLLRGRFATVGWVLCFNVVINGYPIMLQRYNRVRLMRFIEKHHF
jgi:hypothetical protein